MSTNEKRSQRNPSLDLQIDASLLQDQNNKTNRNCDEDLLLLLTVRKAPLDLRPN